MTTLQRRTTLRGVFTRSANTLEELLKLDEFTEEDISNLEIAFELLGEKYKQLRRAEDEYLEELQKGVTTQQDYDAEYASREKYEDRFISLKVKANKMKTKQRELLRSKKENLDVSFSEVRQVKLPEIELKKFDGNPRDWLSFWAQFGKIHDDPKIYDGDKFQYLIQATVPGSKARIIVDSFPASSQNYPKAVEYLKERFGQEKVLIQVYIRDLLQLVISKPKGDLASLYDRLQTQLRSLESLGLTKDKYADVLFPMVESALPVDIIALWERQRSSANVQGKTDLDLLIGFVKNEVESEFRIKLAKESFSSDKPSFKKSSSKQSDPKSFVPTAYELLNAGYDHKFKSVNKCVFCDNLHASENCKEVTNLSLEGKKDILRKRNACFVCLKRGTHRANACKSGHRCPVCKNRHFVILCPGLPTSNREVEESVISNTLSNNLFISDVILQTLVVRLYNGSKELFVRAIFDTGSMKSYVSSDVVKSLNYDPTGEVKLKQSLFGGIETNENVYKNYVINLSDVSNTYTCRFNVLEQKRICSDVKQIPSGPWLNELRKYGVKLTDLDKGLYNNLVDKEIKLLIGADVGGKLLTGGIVSLKSDLTAVHTRLGWTVLGKYFCTKSSIKSNHSLLASTMLTREKCVSDLWNLDTLGITDPAQSQTKLELEEATSKYFNETLRVNEEDRYEVALPWVMDNSCLPDNRKMAEKSLLSTKRKLVNSGKLQDYDAVFDNWLSLGIIEKVSEGEKTRVHYLPHRPVIKEGSTTSIRPVFNASSHTLGFPSLNDCLSTGPNLIEIIPKILNCFRKNYVGVVADIEKAFLQISIREQDRDFLRFLWYKKGDPDEIVEYRHRRVVFGLTCSPYLLAATLDYHLNQAPENLSNTADILRHSFYVDNCVTSLHSNYEAKTFILGSQMIMTSGNFNLRGWKSNVDFGDHGENDTSKCISVLGLIWDTEHDTLSCKIELTNLENPITKRLVLAIAHQLFDPIGFTAPVTLIPKLILQETWSLKLKWDDPLPDDQALKFQIWYDQLKFISEIQIQRWFNLSRSSESVSLHVFCDASQKAYATVVYLRVSKNNEVKVNLVQARTRVAPLKPVTMPRLELLACLIGSRLLKSIIKDFDLELKIYCWTDSTTALYWIRQDKSWGKFVQNRVTEIRLVTTPLTWHYVPSGLNAADLASRGCSVEKLLTLKWWEGPVWLYESEENWPKISEKPDENTVCSELRKTIVTTLTKTEDANWYYRYFSSVKKIIRMLAWILRFIAKSRKQVNDSSKHLSASELERAEITLLGLIQKESFRGVNEVQLKKLRHLIDENGLIRARSNVSYREDTNDFRFPVILPSAHPVVKLIINDAHDQLLHAGTSLLMSHLREKYWIIKARKTIRNCIRKCTKCQRFKSKRCEVTPGILPKDRIRDASIFEVTGVDLAGPLHLKDGTKSYIVLFTCAVYRAIHLELITSLSTEVFLQSLRRFIARRGRPSIIYSDNGTNFKGAERLLHSLDWEALQKKVTELGTEAGRSLPIQWKFSPPSAPWWGGWWERLVQMVKQILRKKLGRAALDYEELGTVLCDCESVINKRPLTYVSEDLDEPRCLTPEMFLREIPGSGVPDIDSVDRDKLSKRAKYLQRIKDQLRVRFRSEYLGQLRQQSLKTFKVEPLKLGEIVLLEDFNKKRVFWNLAKVIKLIPGRDGHARLALVKTKNSEFLRPVQRLFRMEVDNPLI